jgi:predicted ribosome quality control (RQC) complex YloA/Tae2 family protein
MALTDGGCWDAQYLAAIAEAYQLLEQKHKAELLGRRIEQSVKKERTFLDRKAINLQEDLGEARQAEACKRKGELLKNVLHTIRPGDDLVIATDFQTGEMVEIPLDPKLSPAKNLESYFARYQKESRGEDLIRQQLEDLKSVQSRLDEIEQKLKDASDPLSIFLSSRGCTAGCSPVDHTLFAQTETESFINKTVGEK